MQRKLKEATPQHEFTKDDRGPRLQKVLAEAGVDSRRACEELITDGRVRVNGHLVSTLPAWVDPMKDHITVDGRHIRMREPHVYVMLFKPRGVVTTADDPEGRPRVLDFVQHPSKARLYPVGRLEMDASGLLLLSNDGELANRLTHPKHEVHQTYEVVVSGAMDDHAVRKLEAGLFRKVKKETAPAKADRKVERKVESKVESGADAKDVRVGTSRLKLKKRDRDRTMLTMELKEGRNREIRVMMGRLGHNVKKLRRVGIGPLKLRGLQPGQWRELTTTELSSLRRAAGLGD